MESPEFLKNKYNLHNAPEVERAAKRTEQRSRLRNAAAGQAGEKMSQNPEARIQNYLDRLERLTLDPEKVQQRKMFGAEPRPRALSLLREMVMAKYVRPNKEKMAEGAARVEERAAREMGIEAHYGEQELAQRGDIAVEDLEKSLDNWIAYLSDMNEPYPTWFRYYVFRNVLDLGDYDKDKGEFTKRSQGSTRLFPDIDRGALAYVEQMIETAKDPAMLGRLQRAQESTETPRDQLITKEKAANFAKLSFAKQYAKGIKVAGEITPEMKKETRGRWVKYSRGTDPTALWASLQNKGAAWCTKGFATAETQLKGGDFYVYYTYNRQGKPTIPRIAIRMQEENIGEVRGVADNNQNLEGNMAAIAEEKMEELPGAEKYRKASSDMKILTLIDKKSKSGEKLTKNHLIFLYEIDSSIEGFGYQRDPRIEEIRKTRNPEEDASIVFECEPNQIAHNAKEITKNTKAYIGPLFKGVFQLNLEHIGTSFPEGMVKRMEAELTGKNGEEIERELKEKNINISEYASDMLKKLFASTPKHLDLVRLTVKDLGFPNGATTDAIYKRAEELGLELCPQDTGPNFRLQNFTPDWIYIAMKQITDRGGSPCVFYLRRCGDGLWLFSRWASPDVRWDDDSECAFRLRKFLKY